MSGERFQRLLARAFGLVSGLLIGGALGYLIGAEWAALSCPVVR
jgi:hypothetical protein